MQAKRITAGLSVAEQIAADDVAALAEAGFKSIICNRPDGEAADQAVFAEIQLAAQACGTTAHYQPIVSGKVGDADAIAFGELLERLAKPVLAYCRTGTRSTTLWALSEGARGRPLPDILAATKAAGYDMSAVTRRIANHGRTPTDIADTSHDIVIVGGGAAGIAVASSLLARQASLEIAIIDPADVHYYQPGWTMVGAGIFDAATTAKTMASVIPSGVHWIKGAVAAFEPDQHAVILDGCHVVKYRSLIVATGLKLNWAGIAEIALSTGTKVQRQAESMWS